MRLGLGKVRSIAIHAVRKAWQSICKYKVSAIGLNKHGDVIATACNQPRFMRYGGGLHAEMILMKKYRNKIKSIVLCRISRTGKLLPIQPCPVCRKVAQQNNVDIYTL